MQQQRALEVGHILCQLIQMSEHSINLIHGGTHHGGHQDYEYLVYCGRVTSKCVLRGLFDRFERPVTLPCCYFWNIVLYQKVRQLGHQLCATVPFALVHELLIAKPSVSRAGGSALVGKIR